MNASERSLIHDFNNEMAILNAIVMKTEIVINRGGTMDDVKNMIFRLKKRIFEVSTDFQKLVNDEESIDLIDYFQSNKQVSKDDYGLEIISPSETNSFEVITNRSKLGMFLKNIMKNAKEAGATQVVVQSNRDFLIIKDNGTGIPIEVLENIRKNLEATTKGDGHGVGISSMKEFCRNSSLTFEISNQVIDQGAQITIRKLGDIARNFS